jgi:ApaG protein
LLSSRAITRGVLVEVAASFVPERSRPLLGRWLFAYHITISNHGSTTVQLVSRHWIITDARGNVEEITGPGVVGSQPVLEPGASFEYSSFCPLPTPFGEMRGSYQMRDADGEAFEVAIAPFMLAQPMPEN